MTQRFHPLTLAEVRRETDEAVSIGFDVPEALRETYRFVPGQYLTLRATIDGEDVRRTYSICSEPGEPLRVAIKQVPGGRFSTFANQRLAKGEVLQVLPPQGKFTVAARPQTARHHVAFAAGSGITPIMSLLKTLLRQEPESRFTLCFGNRGVRSILFRDELCDLKNRYLNRLAIHHFLSRERQGTPLYDGRLDRPRIERLLDTVLPPQQIDTVMICGPGEMIDETEAALVARGFPATAIVTERFGVPVRAARVEPQSDHAFRAEITLDGVRTRVAGQAGETVLDAAIRAGLDLPFACRGGVCSTCRARLVAGQIQHAVNYALEPWELEAGFVLSCQAHPQSSHIEIDFDQT
ncbi:MAG: 1,2-phenylacetyl-CoA epoxidase subunit PaaE [Myxococcota bacterium]